ncbi:MAG TPA: AMP-binding protein, partial [Pyrinomonadaceae bacterium]|nr:AMP-binding protein [Pyrinomonadaceae bacterium]
MTKSYCERFIAAFEARYDKVAMRIVGDDREIYTFGESLDIIRSLAFRIEQENVDFGDRVALMGENHPSWALAYLGVLYRGSVCVPLDPQGEIETLTNFIENSEAKLAFIGSDQVEKFQQIEEKLGYHIPAVVWDVSAPPRRRDAENRIGNGQNDSHIKNDLSASSRLSGAQNGFYSFSEWSATDYPESFAKELPKADGDDIALLIYTSGTTGTPKGVPLTHGNIVAELEGINEVLKLTDKETILSLLPLFHVYLQIVNLWVATTYGCEVGYLRELSPSELSSAMKAFKPTILTTVPRLWYVFHKKIFDAVETKPKIVRALFRSMLASNRLSRRVFGLNPGPIFFSRVHDSFGGKLRLAVTAGSRFDDNVARDFHDLGFTIIQGYGLTETSGAATATHEDDNRVGSVGKPMKGAEIKLGELDKEGVGEVLIKGPIVFKGYYRNPAATDEAFTSDGWFRSGDLGRIDKHGHLHIVGRSKDVIVLPSGKNVHPEDLEVHYLRAPEVAELAIVGVADTSESRAGAEKLIAVAVPDFEYLRQAHIANSKEAIRYALDNLGRELPEYQRVRDYIVRAEPLPRTATRKIKRFELREAIERGMMGVGLPEKKTWQTTKEDSAILGSNVGQIVISVIHQHSRNGNQVHPKMNLEIDLGLDSLARAEVFAALEQAFQTEFTADEAAAAITVAGVVSLAKETELGQRLERRENISITADLNWSSIIKNADDDLPEVRDVLRKRPLFEAFVYFVYRCFNLFCRVFMRLEVEGIERLENLKPPYLVCPNHQSFLDPFVLCSNYPFHVFRNVFHVGAGMFFGSRIMRLVAKMLNVVPIDQEAQLLRAIKAGAIGLKHGKILHIYPEGERAFDGHLHQFKKGAAILATELDVPIVPVALDGMHKVWARRSRRIRPAKVKIRIGEPFYAKDVA